MLLLATAQAATLSLRLGHAPGVADEHQLGGDGRVTGLTLFGGEVGLDARVTDSFRVGGSVAAAAMGGLSAGGLVEWTAGRWTSTGLVLGGRLSVSRENGPGWCGPMDYCITPGSAQFVEGWGPMLQVRPGVRFGIGKRGAGLTLAAEGRLSARFTGEPSSDGLYAGGLLGVVVSFDVPLTGDVAP